MFRLHLQFLPILAQAPILIGRRQERSIEIVDVGRRRVGGQQLCEVRLCRRAIPLGHRTDSSPGPLNQVLVVRRQLFGKDGPAQTGEPRGHNYGRARATILHDIHQHLHGGLILPESREQQHLVKQYHPPDFRVVAQAKAARLIDVIERTGVVLRFKLAEAQQREARARRTIQVYQPAQRVPCFRILVPVVKQLAQEPPAFRPRRTQLDRLAIQPDRVLDAVLGTRLSGRLRYPVERGRSSLRRLLIGRGNRPQKRSEAESRGCPPQDWSPAQRKMHRYGVSFTCSTWPLRTSFNVWTIPDGQWMTPDSAISFAPNPKGTGPQLDEA